MGQGVRLLLSGKEPGKITWSENSSNEFREGYLQLSLIPSGQLTLISFR